MGSKSPITKRCGRKPAIVKLIVLLNALMLDAAIPQAQTANCTADADARPWTVIGDAATDADLSGAAPRLHPGRDKRTNRSRASRCAGS